MDNASHDVRIEIPDAPTIAGLMFRRLASPGDYPAMRAVRESSLAHDHLDADSARDPLPSLDAYAARFPHSNDPNVLLVEGVEHVIGYARVNSWIEEDGTAVYLHLGYLLPEWRGRGIGTAMLRWAQARCRQLASESAANVKGPVVLATNACVTEREAVRLLVRAGYTVVRRIADLALTVADTAALPIPTPLPAGTEMRPVTPEQYRAIYAMCADAWAGTWGNEPAGEQGYRDFLEEHVEIPTFNPTLWRVAWADDEAIGGVITRVRADSGVGVVEDVATRKAWQRRGVARALLLASLHALADADVTAIRIATDAENHSGARGLYERVGFRVTTEHQLYRKPLS